jgi:Methyltransferase FkbM domain
MGHGLETACKPAETTEAGKCNGKLGGRIKQRTRFKMSPFRRVLGRMKELVTGQATSKSEVSEFLRKIRPMTTNHALIRIGSAADGGYLVPDDFTGIEICFSPGVANQSDFELAMAERNIISYMADYSVDGPAFHNSLFHFEKKFLGPVETDIYTTLENWINRNAPGKADFILQMDIEDSEYDVLLSTPQQTLQKFRIMAIEFHRFRKLFTKKQLAKLNLVFDKLLQDFVVVHNHPNNHARVINYRGLKIPLLTEITFLRKDRVTRSSPTLSFPHQLDQGNVKNRPDLKLPDCWYKF